MVDKIDLIEHIASATDSSKAAATASLDAALEGIANALKRGEEVRLVGFGTFSVEKRATGKRRDQTNIPEIKIPASKSWRFKPGATLKVALNKTSGPSDQLHNLFPVEAVHVGSPSEANVSHDEMRDITRSTNEAVEALCRENSGKAFDLAIESLDRSADMMDKIVEDTRQGLIEIEMRRKQIDRTQARTREILNDLLGRAQ